MKNKKLKAVIVTLCLSVFTQVSAFQHESQKSSNIYLIASTPFYNSLISYPTTLYKIDENHKLNRLRGIITQNQGTLFVRPYYDNQKVIIGSVNNEEYLQLDIINMENPYEEKSAELKICNECVYTSGYFIDEGTSASFALFRIWQANNQTKLTLYGINLDSKKSSIFEHSKLRDVQSFGGSNGNFTSDHLKYLATHNNQAVFTDALKIDLGWQLPTKLQLSEGARFTQLVNNRNIRLIQTFASFKADIQEFFVLNKMNNQWL